MYNEPASPAAVDVRDMLCAQALAMVAQAMGRRASGAALRVLVNGDDVRRDLLIWAQERRCGVRDLGAGVLELTAG